MHDLHQMPGVRALRFFAAALAIAPGGPVLASDCAVWNVAGQWNAVQANSGGNTYPLLTLQQDGTSFKGSASYITPNHVTVQGPVVGTVQGNVFEATIYWNGRENQVGVYSGQIDPQGLVVGHTVDKNHPASQSDWHADHAFECRTPLDPGVAGNTGNSGSAGNGAKPPIALGRTHAPGPRAPNVSELPGTTDSARQTRGDPAAVSGALSRSTTVTPLKTPAVAPREADLGVQTPQPAASAPSLLRMPAPGAFR